MKLRSFGRAFFAGEASVDRFLPRARSLDELSAWMSARSSAGPQEVYAELRRQNPSAEALVDELEKGHAIITGQQIALFLGPLYTFHKALSAVLLAKALRERGHHAAPIFWLQCEDHDLREVEHVSVRDRTGRLVALGSRRDETRVSLAHQVSDEHTQQALSRLRSALEGQPRSTHLLRELEAAYAEGRSYVDAFVRCLRMLFGEDELLVFNPRTSTIAASLSALHQRAYTQTRALGAALGERSRTLARAGFATQVPIRDDCALSFFHPEGPEGPRYRLRENGDAYTLAGRDGTWSQDELDALCSDEPLRFSSSALLRPVIQDFLFPACAYIGGPGELSYYAQLEPIYKSLGVEAGWALPRLRARYLSTEAKHRLERWQVSEPFEAPSSWTGSLPDVRAAKNEVRGLLADANTRLSKLEPWAGAVKRAQRSIEGAAQNLVDKIDREALKRSELQRDYQLVMQELAPGGAPQERALAVPDLLARYAPMALRRALAAAYRPLEDHVLLIDETTMLGANSDVERTNDGHTA